MSIRFNNYAKSMGRRGDSEYFQRRIFVDEPPEVLAKIAEVEYLLHPTFPQPHQVRRNASDKFALESAGWGEFNVLITVKHRDGSEEHTKYYLTLTSQEKPWPVEQMA